MADINNRLFRSYSELCSLLEKLPNGLTFVEINTKIASFKNMKKKELDGLLNYVRKKERIEVIDVTRKGVASSPLLRHKKYSCNKLSVVEQPVLSCVSSIPNNSTVYTSQPGRVTISLKRKRLTELSPVDTLIEAKHIVETQPLPESKVTEETNTMETTTTNPALPERLQIAAADVLVYLKNTGTGANRTQLAEKFSTFRKLSGSNRTTVIEFIKKHHNVKEGPSQGMGSSKVLFHPDSIKVSQDKSNLPKENPLKNSITLLVVDKEPKTNTKAVPTQEQVKQDNPQPERAFAMKTNLQLSSEDVAGTSDNIRERAIRMLLEAEKRDQLNENQALLEMVKPIYDEMKQHYTAASKALEQQIDSLSAMGIALDKLSAIIDSAKPIEKE